MSQQDALKVLKRMFMEEIDITSPKATAWLRKNLKNIGQINPKSLVNTSGVESSIVKFKPGSIYLFGYNPKTKNSLPYYDLYPMTLLLDISSTGFLGLNFHYLDHMDRQVFFNNLTAYLNDDEFDDNPKAYFDINYVTLKSVQALSHYRPTIKRYYYKNIVSKVSEIPPIYWKFMLFLPLEQFQKEVKENVWKESKRKI